LDFAGEFFVLALGFQLRVVCDLSGFLFDVAFYFMTLAFDLILRACFHLVPPFKNNAAWGPKPHVFENKVETPSPASCLVQVLPSIGQEVLKIGRVGSVAFH
jgi:hypothetical protein